MNTKQLLLGAVIIGVVANILDGILHGMLLVPTYNSIPSMSGMDPGKMPWFIFSDFVLALVFVWFYGRVHASFEKTPMGLLKYGVFFAIVVSIPTNMITTLIFKGFPYWLSWVWTLAFVIEYAIYGYILGMLVRPKTAKA
ncbi:MAG TPA: hypothetical protein VFA55_08125 [Candidatus Kapabacteria bacterium]|nr:hypothetical protein [Candidatus Kapabacteria bacterium]